MPALYIYSDLWIKEIVPYFKFLFCIMFYFWLFKSVFTYSIKDEGKPNLRIFLNNIKSW